ncbi:MAG: hypothetical protein J5777_05445 [Clostridiales bacterium]|nr:hypothetical protein [Clostridiales bacterium]
MNNWEKNNLELTPAPEMTLIDESGDLTILIKHDYYSSDTEHGRFLLGSFIDSLCESGEPILKVILIDSAVNLICDPFFSSKISKLFSASRYSYVCEDSLEAFDVDFTPGENVTVCPASDISMQILQSAHLITLS